MSSQDEYESRIARIRTTIRACLDSHERDEDFFSASDGDEDSPPRLRDDQAAVEKEGDNISAADGTFACAFPISITSDVTIADDGRGGADVECSPLPAHHERGPTSQTENKVRLMSTSNSTLLVGPPHNGNPKLPGKGGMACRSRETTEEAEPNSCVAGRSNASNTCDKSAAAPTLTAAASHEQPWGAISFAGISVSGLRPVVKVSHHRYSLEVVLCMECRGWIEVYGAPVVPEAALRGWS